MLADGREYTEGFARQRQTQTQVRENQDGGNDWLHEPEREYGLLCTVLSLSSCVVDAFSYASALCILLLCPDGMKHSSLE